MFAFVSNEYQGIVYSKQHVQVLSSIYSYPVVQYCRTEEECRDYISRHPRKVFDSDANKRAGWKKTTAYIRIEYFVGEETIYANLYTDHFGYIMLNLRDKNVLQQAEYDMIKLKIRNVNVHDESIVSHCVAIQYILQLLSPIINVQIVVPDLSIYLALTEYTGRNVSIIRIRQLLKTRVGKVALLLK